MRFVAPLLVVLLAIVDFSSAVNVTCLNDNEFIVHVEAADGLDGYYVRPQDVESCNTSVQLSADQSALITCYEYTVGEPFNIVFHQQDGILTDTANLTIVNVTCNAQTEVNVTDFVTVTLPPADENVTGIISVSVDISVSPPTVAIGQIITVTFTVTGGNADEYVIGLDSFQVITQGISYYLIDDSCVLDSQVSVTVSGNATGVLTVSYPAFYYFGSNPIVSPVVISISAVVLFCHEDDGIDNCIIDTTTSCNDSLINPVRRRRQAEGAQTKDLETRVVLFINEADREEYVANIMDQEGISRQTQSEDDLCVNKTVSSVVLVLLIVGMIICLLAAVWMFILLRRARRRESKLSENPTVFGLSNRGYR